VKIILLSLPLSSHTGLQSECHSDFRKLPFRIFPLSQSSSTHCSASIQLPNTTTRTSTFDQKQRDSSSIVMTCHPHQGTSKSSMPTDISSSFKGKRSLQQTPPVSCSSKASPSPLACLFPCRPLVFVGGTPTGASRGSSSTRASLGTGDKQGAWLGLPKFGHERLPAGVGLTPLRQPQPQ